MAGEHDGELGVFAFTLAHQHRAFAIFGVAHAFTLLQPVCPVALGNVHLWPGKRTALRHAALAAEESRDIVQRVTIAGRSPGRRRLRSGLAARLAVGEPRRLLALVLVVEGPLGYAS